MLYKGEKELKIYIKPNVEIIEFNVEDEITFIPDGTGSTTSGEQDWED